MNNLVTSSRFEYISNTKEHSFFINVVQNEMKSAAFLYSDKNIFYILLPSCSPVPFLGKVRNLGIFRRSVKLHVKHLGGYHWNFLTWYIYDVSKTLYTYRDCFQNPGGKSKLLWRHIFRPQRIRPRGHDLHLCYAVESYADDPFSCPESASISEAS